MAEDSGEPVREASESAAAVNTKFGMELMTAHLAAQLQEQHANTQAINAERTANMGAMNQLRLASLAQSIDRINTTSPEEGVTPVSLAQQLAKTAGNTPPVTP